MGRWTTSLAAMRELGMSSLEETREFGTVSLAETRELGMVSVTSGWAYLAMIGRYWTTGTSRLETTGLGTTGFVSHRTCEHWTCDLRSLEGSAAPGLVIISSTTCPTATGNSPVIGPMNRWFLHQHQSEDGIVNSKNTPSNCPYSRPLSS